MLLLESFERPLMLFLDSLAVAPLKPVPADEVCFFCDDDLEGTLRRPRPLFVLLSSGEIRDSSFILSWFAVGSDACFATSDIMSSTRGTKAIG
jgi:hypothetical protein